MAAFLDTLPLTPELLLLLLPLPCIPFYPLSSPPLDSCLGPCRRPHADLTPTVRSAFELYSPHPALAVTGHFAMPLSLHPGRFASGCDGVMSKEMLHCRPLVLSVLFLSARILVSP